MAKKTARKTRPANPRAATTDKIPKSVPLWRYYFINRRVANLVGFYIILFGFVLATTHVLKEYLPYTAVFTLHAAFTIWISHFFWTHFLSRMPTRRYA